MTAPADPVRYRRNPAIPSGEIHGEVMALDIRQGHCFGMAGVGAAIWRLLDQPRSIDDLVAALVADYEVEPDRCAADVGAFVDELVAAGLAERAGA